MSTSGKRIVFTGGSGKAGRHAIPYLLAQGHKVLNLDLIPFPDPEAGVYTLKTDLTDSGQCFNALSSHFDMSGYEDAEGPGKVDAVVHFAAYARNMLVPDSELFQANVRSTYNVIEAACKLGIPKVIIASSETTYGVCFAQGDTDYDYYPLDEEYDVNPEDSYALSKICGEKTARAFSKRFHRDIYALRIGNVIEPHEYATLFPTFLSQPHTRKRNAWSYIDARDLGQIVDLCIKKDGLGFQVFNAVNDSVTYRGSTKDLLQEMKKRKNNQGQEGKDVVFKRELGENEALMSNKKIRDVLGFKEEHDWKKYVK